MADAHPDTRDGRLDQHRAEADSRRDWLDKASLATAIVGAVVLVVSTIITQVNQMESAEDAAAALKTLTSLASSAQTQAESAQNQVVTAREQTQRLQEQIQQLSHQAISARSQAQSALRTVSLSEKQLSISQSHYRLSVRPEMIFIHEAAPSESMLGVYLQNTGLGPARVGDYKVFIDGKKIGSYYDLPEIDPDNISPQYLSYFRLYNPQTLKEGTKLWLISASSSNILNRSRFDDMVNHRIFMIARYCSLYDECKIICSRPGQLCRDETLKLEREPSQLVTR